MKGRLIILLVILGLPLAAWANATAPEYRGPHSNLRIIGQGDLSAWEFFLVSGDKVRETDVSGGGIGDFPLSTGPSYSLAICYAVPTKQLDGYERASSGQFPARVLTEIAHVHLPGMVELFRHRFFGEKPEDPASLLINEYNIELRDGHPIALPTVSVDGSQATPTSSASQRARLPKPVDDYAANSYGIAAGLALTAMLVAAGLWLFRRNVSPTR